MNNKASFAHNLYRVCLWLKSKLIYAHIQECDTKTQEHNDKETKKKKKRTNGSNRNESNEQVSNKEDNNEH